MRGLLAAFAFGLAALGPAPAAAQGTPPSVETAATVNEAPFTLFRDKILVEVEIGGRKLTAVYDSGAGRSLLAKDAAEALATPLAGTAVLQGFGGEARGQIAREVAARIGERMHVYALLPVADLSPFTSRFGRPIDFLIGVDAFPDDVLEVDWAGSRLRWTPRAAFAPPAGASEIRFDRRQGLYRTTIRINGREASANVDLGASEALAIASRLSDRLDLQTTTDGLVTGIGGDLEIRYGSLSEATFAGLSFRDAPFMREDSRYLPGGVDVNIGLPLLARFRLFFDYREERAWLAPLPQANGAPLPRNTTGLRIGRPAPDRLEVLYVSRPSPAFAAGLRKGDMITAVDGAPVSAMTIDTDMTAWTRAPSGGVRLTLADGREITVNRTRFY